ncbi:MAG TPA: PAS domain S-box protein [Burkholderiales bacterium]|nr:PAS domain S-box protein [Burkholderiales bacterium]
MPLDDKIFRLLVDRIRDYALFVLDPDGRVVSWNAGARKIKGYEAEEIMGQHFSVFYTQEAIAKRWPWHELQMATMQGRFEDEGWRVKKDGSRFWANVVITALRDDNGHLLGFSKITRDLTDRRRQEEVLRESEERFRLLIEGVVDYAIFMLDPDGIITSWNAGAQAIKGYTRDEAIGSHFSLFYTPEDIQAGKPWEELAHAHKAGRAEDEGWRIRKNGEKFWARAVLNALHDSEGRLRGFAKITQDLSQRQHAHELERTAQQLNEFIAILAHELRNPLAPICNAVQLMDRIPHTDPAQEAMRRTIARQSAHLVRIVDDLLDIARITRGTFSIVRRAIDVAEVIGRAVEVARPAIEQAGHALEVELPTVPVHVDGDIDRLAQVVGNLLGNAVRFTPPGGDIGVKAWREGGRAMICVRDNGRGIAAADLEGIFGMFVQGKEPIHRIGKGLGIGLALARRVVELHGGTIEARSEGEGKGSEFVVRIPIGSPPAQERSGTGQVKRPVSKSAGKRILIVDDNVDAANVLERLLQSSSHDEIRVVHDGPQAIEVANEFRPDIVLLDIGLPGINGYEVARRLRARQGRSMRIIAITGWGQEPDKARSREAGFDLHLVKPVDEAVLLEILEADGYGNGTTIP